VLNNPPASDSPWAAAAAAEVDSDPPPAATGNVITVPPVDAAMLGSTAIRAWPLVPFSA